MVTSDYEDKIKCWPEVSNNLKLLKVLSSWCITPHVCYIDVICYRNHLFCTAELATIGPTRPSNNVC